MVREGSIVHTYATQIEDPLDEDLKILYQNIIPQLRSHFSSTAKEVIIGIADGVELEASNRFCKIRTALSNAWKEYNKTGDRNVITAHYNKQLEEIENNGIMEWILDRRGNDDLPNGQTKAKSKKMIRNDYPDTRGYYEE